MNTDIAFAFTTAPLILLIVFLLTNGHPFLGVLLMVVILEMTK